MMTTSNNTIQRSDFAELVFVPMPGMGHLLALVEMAKLILVRDERISVTVYLIDRNVPKIDAYVQFQSRNNPYPTRLNFITLPTTDPPDPSTPHFFTTLFEFYKPIVKQVVVGRIKSGSPKPVGFVLDMFCTTMIDIANELNIPSYIFFASGANFLNLMFHAQFLADQRGVDNVATEFSDPSREFRVPGFKDPITSKVVPALLQDKETGCPVNVNHTRRYRNVKGILVNTFMELETFAVQTLLDEKMSRGDNESIPHVYPVGPILKLDVGSCEGGTYYKQENDKETVEIMKWLDVQPEISVVFLCFGSMGCFDEDQVKEIAQGLDGSGYRFLWSLRRPPPKDRAKAPPRENNETFEEALPEGFLDRTAHKGKVIGWAPQVSILAHPAIGGFVSHCGWNSVLESIWFGVPIATWPIYAEQQLNAFELVKELDLAVEIRMDYKQERKTGKSNAVVTSDEIENGINKLMCIDEELKGRIRKKRDQSRRTIQYNGSSYNFLGCFIENVFDNNVDVAN